MTIESQERIRARYIRDGSQVRLGGLAANLARINSFSRHDGGRASVESVIDESKHFIEWTYQEVDLDVATELLALQRLLIRWQRQLDQIWPNPALRDDLSASAKIWSEKLLALSGLLPQNSQVS